MNHSEILKLTRNLVEIPSVTGDQKNSLAVLDLASNFLGKTIHSATYTKGDILSRIWGDQETLLEPRLLLSGHIDVVGADKGQFSPKVKDQKLFGRGSGDMKGHVATLLSAYKKWVETYGARGISLLLTSDEEIGGFNGARHVIEQGLRPKLVFIPDGDLDFNIVKSQKAPHHFHVRATGMGGHASRAFEIDNPVNGIMHLYLQMREKYALASKRSPWHSTFELTVINTPNTSANAVPDAVEAWFSWRFPLEEFNFQEGARDLKRLSKGLGIEILDDEHGFGEGCYTNPHSPAVKSWKRAIEAELGRGVKFVNMHGATDGRHFFKYGSEVIVTSAISGNHHGMDEWVDIASLVKLANALYTYLQII